MNGDGEMWLAIVAVAGVVAWRWLARRSFAYLLPAYMVLAVVPAPIHTTVLVFPNLGLGTLERPFPSLGDVLLVATVLLAKGPREQLFKRLPLALAGVSAVGIVVGLYVHAYPAASVLYLGVSPLRLALLLAVAAASWPDAPRKRKRAALLALALFFVPAVAGIVAAAASGTVEALEHVGLMAGGRIAYPTLGNNKIGQCLVLLVAALLIAAGRRNNELPSRLYLVWAVTFATVVSAGAELRFATTALIVVAMLLCLRESPALAAAGLFFGTIGFVAVILRGQAGDTSVRALGVLSGTFEGLGDSSANSRFELWGMALRLWRDHPFVGRAGAWEFDREPTRLVFQAPIEAHSEFTWQLASFGLLGALVLGAVVVVLLRGAARAGGVAVVSAALGVLGLGLNAATFFPVAAACLAVAVDAGRRRLSDDGAGGVPPVGAVAPDRTAERGVVHHRPRAHAGR